MSTSRGASPCADDIVHLEQRVVAVKDGFFLVNVNCRHSRPASAKRSHQSTRLDDRGAARVDEQRRRFHAVITSYSIHYTKLYELMGAAEKDVNAESLGQGLRAVQIDAIMITEQ